MKNLISKWIEKGSGKLDATTRGVVYGENLKGSDLQPTETDIAMRKLMAYFTEAIHDDDFASILFEKIMPRVISPQTDEKGDIVYKKDVDGKIQLDGKGEPIINFREGRKVNDYYAALNNMLSPLNRLSHVNPKQVKLLSLYAEDVVSDILMSRPPWELDEGEIAFLNSLQNTILLLLMDATEGQKLRALLTLSIDQHKSIDVQNSAKKKAVA